MPKFFKLVNGEYLPMSTSEIKLFPLVKFLKETFYQLPSGQMVKSVAVPNKHPELLDEFTDALMNVE